jgi:SAM-dependent methyltransferase
MSVGVSGAPPAPVLETRALDHCLACGGRALSRRALRYEYRETRFPLVECETCGMRFLGVQPTGASLAGLYAEPYFESDFRCGRSTATSFDDAAFAAENDALLDAFTALGPPGRLLEVGCAAGRLLERAAARRWKVKGIEPSHAAATFARSLGLDVFEGELASAHLPEASVDLVYMGDVLEHVPDCRATLEEVRRVLAPGGVLYLRGPITTHSLARSLALGLYGAMGREIVLREPPYHLWEFTPRALERLARATGFEAVRLRQAKIPPGGARGGRGGFQRAAMAAIDAVNLPLTAAFNVRGDRVVMTARRPAAPKPL